LENNRGGDFSSFNDEIVEKMKWVSSSAGNGYESRIGSQAQGSGASQRQEEDGGGLTTYRKGKGLSADDQKAQGRC